MDIEVAYRNQTRAFGALRQALNDEDAALIAEAAEDLADAVEAIDGWLRGGGFLPLAWKASR